MRAALVCVGDKPHMLLVESVQSKNGGFSLVVRCDCGIVKRMMYRTFKSSKSCGCSRSRLISETKRKVSSVSGASRTHKSEYTAYTNMMARCYNESNPQYDDYGGRGITVSAEWKESFNTFLMDMGAKPDPSLTLERIDNSKGYGRGNCEWAPRSRQNRNHRRNANYTFNGRTQCVTDWAKEVGMTATGLHSRIKRLGVEAALTPLIK